MHTNLQGGKRSERQAFQNFKGSVEILLDQKSSIYFFQTGVCYTTVHFENIGFYPRKISARKGKKIKINFALVSQIGQLLPEFYLGVCVHSHKDFYITKKTKKNKVTKCLSVCLFAFTEGSRLLLNRSGSP